MCGNRWHVCIHTSSCLMQTQPTATPLAEGLCPAMLQQVLNSVSICTSPRTRHMHRNPELLKYRGTLSPSGPGPHSKHSDYSSCTNECPCRWPLPGSAPPSNISHYSGSATYSPARLKPPESVSWFLHVCAASAAVSEATLTPQGLHIYHTMILCRI